MDHSEPQTQSCRYGNLLSQILDYSNISSQLSCNSRSQTLRLLVQGMIARNWGLCIPVANFIRKDEKFTRENRSFKLEIHGNFFLWSSGSWPYHAEICMHRKVPQKRRTGQSHKSSNSHNSIAMLPSMTLSIHSTRQRYAFTHNNHSRIMPYRPNWTKPSCISPPCVEPQGWNPPERSPTLSSRPASSSTARFGSHERWASTKPREPYSGI